MENNRIFALRRWILLWQNPRATEGRPYGCFFDKHSPGSFRCRGILSFQCKLVVSVM